MNDKIEISEKHGLNPTIPLCFWCGKEKNEIAILGKLKDDKEAPHNCFVDYEPCEECKKEMDKGITFIGVSEEPIDKNMPPMSKNGDKKLYPTGVYCVFSEQSAQYLIKNKEVLEETLKSRKILIDSDLLVAIVNKIKREGE